MQIIGHRKIINFLNKSIERDSTSAAYLFCGVEHLGKFTVALDFAQKITGPSSVDERLSSRVEALGADQKINPDIIIIRPIVEEKKGIAKKKDIKVEQIRELQRGLAMTPYFGHCKVALIDDADRLTKAAQNALLKILEEPDDRSILILICHDQEKILPTIKSRCITRSFSPVSEKEIARLLSGGKLSQGAAFWSLGRPGLALEFLSQHEKLQTLDKARQELAQIFQCSVADKFSLAEELAKDAQTLKEKLQLWTIMLRQNLKGCEDFLAVPPRKALEIIEETAKSLQLIQETNSNARVVLENLFLKF